MLDVTTDESRVGLVAAGSTQTFIWGVHQTGHGGVRVSPDHRPAIMGAPAYFEAHPKPKSPRDLLNHRTNFRRGSQRVYRRQQPAALVH